jgi:hypothetical protein
MPPTSVWAGAASIRGIGRRWRTWLDFRRTGFLGKPEVVCTLPSDRGHILMELLQATLA